MYSQIDINSFKGVLIDLDDTLYLYNPCHKVGKSALLSLFCNQYQTTLEEADSCYANARKKVHSNLNGQAASHSRLLYAKYMVEEVSDSVDSQNVLDLEEAYWGSFLNEMQLHPDAITFLEECKNQSKPIAIVTDLTTQIQLRKFKKLQLSKWVDHMITSEEAGEEKPESKPFQMALESLNLKAIEVIMIGDNEKKDKVGAESLGIKWFHPFK